MTVTEVDEQTRTVEALDALAGRIPDTYTTVRRGEHLHVRMRTARVDAWRIGVQDRPGQAPGYYIQQAGPAVPGSEEPTWGDRHNLWSIKQPRTGAELALRFMGATLNV